MDYKEIENIQAARAMTGDDLDRIIFSARSEIENVEKDPGYLIDPEAVKQILCIAVSAAHILEMCSEDPSYFYKEASVLPVSALFGKDSDEELLRLHAELRMKVIKGDHEDPGTGLPGSIPDEREPSVFELIVFVDEHMIRLDRQNGFIHELYEETEGSDNRDIYTNEIKRIYGEMTGEAEQVCSVLREASVRENCPYIIDAYLLRMLDRMRISESGLIHMDTEECFDLFEGYLDEALRIYIKRRNSDALRQYAQAALKSIVHDRSLEMENRMHAKFGLVRDLIAESGLIVTDPVMCHSADALLLHRVYEVYRTISRDRLDKRSQLALASEEAAFTEQAMKRSGAWGRYIQSKNVEYMLMNECAGKGTVQERFEALVFFEKELEKQWVCTSKGTPNKLVRQLAIYIDGLKKKISEGG